MTTHVSLAARFAILLAISATIGCGQRDRGRPEENAESKESTSSAASPSADVATPSDDATPNEFDPASVLSDATKQFSDVFSDDERADASDGELTGTIDERLVDEETRRKYVVDRTLVAPVLAERADADASTPKYRLEYRFVPQTNMHWSVTHRVRKRVSYGGKEKLIETSSTTERRWELLDADADGKVRARHWIDRMILRQDDHEKPPVDYDSERDVVVPREISAFGTEKAVGVVLETFAIDPHGVASDKTKLIAQYNGREGDSTMMVPFPDAELAVGDVWTTPYALYLKGADETVRPYRVVERFRLESVDEKYATISFETTLASIVDDPVVEGALAERLFTGRALFDRELGQTTRTELNFKKSVAGAFGFSSFLDYDCRVEEKWERSEPRAEKDAAKE